MAAGITKGWMPLIADSFAFLCYTKQNCWHFPPADKKSAENAAVNSIMTSRKMKFKVVCYRALRKMVISRQSTFKLPAEFWLVSSNPNEQYQSELREYAVALRWMTVRQALMLFKSYSSPMTCPRQGACRLIATKRIPATPLFVMFFMEMV